jgi:cyanophycin synthetase
LCDFISKLDFQVKIGVISGTGDRRNEDIRELGEISARHFDEIIIRCDKNLRGRTADEIIELLKEGIEKVNPSIPVMVIPDENEALEYIYAHHKPNALYTVMCDVVAGALDKIRELKERDEKEGIKTTNVEM